MKGIIFSVVIPTYNRADFIKGIITSFLLQTYPHFELLVIDDGGSDDTAEKVLSFNDARVKYFRKENGERGAARKFGASLAEGDYINYFDSDDLPYKNHLQTASEVIVKYNRPNLFHLGFEYKNEKGDIVGKPEIITGVGNKKMLSVNYINPNPLFVHKDTLQDVTYNDDRNLAASEDWLYHLQLVARYDLIACGNHITSCMIQHANRSMNQYSGDSVLSRNLLLLKYLKQDEVFMNKYKPYVDQISAEMTSLAALHYVLEGKKINALKTLIETFNLSPSKVFKRRTLAIMKYLFLK